MSNIPLTEVKLISQVLIQNTLLLSTKCSFVGPIPKFESKCNPDEIKALDVFEKIKSEISKPDLVPKKIESISDLFEKDSLYRLHELDGLQIKKTTNPQFCDLNVDGVGETESIFFTLTSVKDRRGDTVNCLPIIDPKLIKLIHSAFHPRSIWLVRGIPVIFQNSLTILIVDLHKSITIGQIDYSVADRDNLMRHILYNSHGRKMTLDEVWSDCEDKFNTSLTYSKIYRALQSLTDKENSSRNSFGQREYVIPPLNTGTSVNEISEFVAEQANKNKQSTKTLNKKSE